MWIVYLILVIGFVVLVNYLRRKARVAFSQGVLDRGGHAQGKEATAVTVEFTAPVSSAEVISSIVSALALPTELPGAFIARLVLASSDDSSAFFVYGNKAVQTFRSALVSENLPDGGSKSSYTVLNWRLSDGIVQGIGEMKMLENSIRNCAGQLGASYSVAPVSTPVDQPVSVPGPPAELAPVGGNSFCTECGSSQLGTRFCTECGATLTVAS